MDSINKFFEVGESEKYASISEFTKSHLYEYFRDLYGDLVMVPDPDIQFLKFTRDGRVIDEIYAPDESRAEHQATFIPIKLLGNKKPDNHPMWQALKDDGYYIDYIDIHPIVKAKALAIPFEKDRNLPPSILNVHYEKIHYQVLDTAKYSNKPRLERRHLETDALKYIFDPDDDSMRGPYDFHMDYTPDVYYMYFNYITEANPVVGRELIIGERRLDSVNWSREGLLRSGEVHAETKIPIKNGMIVFMNTYNPKFVHRVNKLRADQEAITLTTYVYT